MDRTVNSRTQSNHRPRGLRLPYADPAERVAPARPHPAHMAIVIACLTVMFLAAAVGTVKALTGGVTVAVALTVLAVTVVGVAVMRLADRRFQGRS
jgi:hypothetical protein